MMRILAYGQYNAAAPAHTLFTSILAEVNVLWMRRTTLAYSRGIVDVREFSRSAAT